MQMPRLLFKEQLSTPLSDISFCPVINILSFVPFPIRSFMRYSFDNIFKSRGEEARIKANINQFSVSSIRLLFFSVAFALAASDNFLPSAFHHRCASLFIPVFQIQNR